MTTTCTVELSGNDSIDNGASEALIAGAISDWLAGGNPWAWDDPADLPEVIVINGQAFVWAEFTADGAAVYGGWVNAHAALTVSPGIGEGDVYVRIEVALTHAELRQALRDFTYPADATGVAVIRDGVVQWVDSLDTARGYTEEATSGAVYAWDRSGRDDLADELRRWDESGDETKEVE